MTVKPTYDELERRVKELERDIADRNRVEEELKRSEVNYRSIFNAVNDAVFVHEFETGRILDVNTKMCEMYGYAREEVNRLDVEDLSSGVSPFTHEEASRWIQRAIDGDPQIFEWMAKDKSGRLFWVEVNLKRVTIGDQDRIVAVVRDIAKRKQAEQAVKAESLRRDILMDTSRDGIAIINQEHRVVEANRRFAEMLGYTMEEVLQLHTWDYEAVATEFQIRSNYNDLTKTDAVFQTKHRRKDGTTFDVEICATGALVLDEPLVMSISRDITERKRAEEKTTRFGRVLEDSLNEIYMFDAQTLHFIEVNRGARINLGYSMEELRGLTPVGIKPEFTMELFEKMISPLRTGVQETVCFNTVHRRKDGTRYPVEVHLQFIQGSPSLFVAFILDITDRKKAEEEREKLDAQLSNAMALANLGHWEHDIIHNVVTLNDHFYRIYDTTVEQVGGYTMSAEEMMRRFVHPDDLEPLRAHLREIAVKADSLSGDQYEHRILCPDGNVGHAAVRISYIKDTSGKVIKAFGVTQDITDRKRVEEALEKRMISLTRPLDDPERIAFDDLFNIEDIQRLQDQFAEATGVASIITHTDGTPITKPSRFCRLCADIIRKTEKGLLNCYQSDDVLGRRNSEGPVIRHCLGGGLWNAGAGISVGGKHIATWLIGQVRDETQTDEKMRAYAREIGADEHDVSEAFHEVTPMSREQFEVVARTLFTLADQLSAAAYQNVQQARFITELKQAGEEKEKLESQLLQAQKMEAVGRLAGGVAHDFNNMLSLIIGHADMVIARMNPSDPFFPNLKEIRSAGERSADLTRQLLAFARKQTIAPKKLDLNEAIGKTFKMLQRLIGEDIRLTWIPGRKLWPVKVDPAQLDQILANLCVNAKDAIDDIGEITIETENAVLAEPFCSDHPGCFPGEYVRIAVSDNGCGMDDETLEKIFEPFFTTKEVGKGTGLGLATVYGIVKQNNGFIDVGSKPGQGTVFTIYLPRDASDATDMSEDRVGKSVRNGHETIMIVEDEPAIIKMAAMMLESMGYTVLTAETPGEAIRLARDVSNRIKLLVVDVIMPEMNGRDLAKEISTFHPELKVLFISGYPADIIAHHGILDAGVNFISKPFSLKELSAKVREVLDDDRV